MSWPTRRKNEAPIPLKFPGDFFVLRWDRELGGRFILELDDEDESSYDLGDDPLHVVALLRIRGYGKLSREDAVDRAKEFGMCQCIPEGDGKLRLIQVLPRDAKKPPLAFQEQRNEWLRNSIC